MYYQIKLILKYKKTRNDDTFKKIVLSFKPLILKYMEKVPINYREDIYQDLLYALLLTINRFKIIEAKGENRYLKKFKEKYSTTLYENINEIFKYEFNNLEHTTDVSYDNTKFIKPRIETTIDSNDRYKRYMEQTFQQVDKLITNYEYDGLGRILGKNRINGNGYPAEYINTSFEYKPGTNLKKKISYTIGGSQKVSRQCEFNYSYNSRGLIDSQTFKYENKNMEKYDNSYVYDEGNRLKSERNNSTNKQINYYYNTDGTLSNIEKPNCTIRYVYKSGRLTKIRCNENSSINKTFAYDNMGNCIDYNGNTITWERAKLLKKFASESNEISYYYNNEGLLVKKEKGTEVNEYIYEHGKLLFENVSGKILEYIYDKDEIIGFTLYLPSDLYQVYYFIKDVTGNVIAITSNNEEIARYSYDTWGKVSIDYDSGKGIAELNPIRWKSQYYDNDLQMYYINQKFYSLEITQFISSENIESVLDGQFTLYALNLYTLNVANPINLMYNNNTIFENCALEHDPPKLSAWDRFWRTKTGKNLSVFLGIIALIVVIISSIVFQQWWILGGFITGIASTLAIGGAIAGIVSSKNGDSFWRGFSNFINDNWSQTLAVESIFTIITCGIQLAVAAIKNARPRRISKAIVNAAKENGVKVKLAKKSHFTDESWEKIKELEYTPDIGTNSNMKYGRDIHSGYRANMIKKGKEFSPKGSRLRMDFVNRSRRIIYELKPNNYKSAIQKNKTIC